MQAICYVVPVTKRRVVHMMTGVAEGDSLFTCKSGDVISPSQWTRMVAQIYRRNAGVAVSPKDLRSSYITHLKGGQHDDDSLRDAALAMRHNTATQGSAAYHKRNSMAQRAVREAASFSAQFVHGAI